MADNVAVSEGSGKTVRTDDVGGFQHQMIKVMAGAEGVAADAALQLASDNFTRLANATPYSIDDFFGDHGTAASVTELEYSIAAGRGTVYSVSVLKTTGGNDHALRLYFLEGSVATSAGDNIAFSAPLLDCFGYVDVSIVDQGGSDFALGFATCALPFIGNVTILPKCLDAFTPGSADVYHFDFRYMPG